MLLPVNKKYHLVKLFTQTSAV